MKCVFVHFVFFFSLRCSKLFTLLDGTSGRLEGKAADAQSLSQTTPPKQKRFIRLRCFNQRQFALDAGLREMSWMFVVVFFPSVGGSALRR